MTVSDRVNVQSSDLTGGTGRWVREFGRLSGVRASWGRQGGCVQAQFTLDVPPRWGRGELPLLRRGRSVSVYDGTVRLWQGRITESVRDDSLVSVTCEGWASRAGEFAASSTALDTPNVAVTAGVPTTINEAIDNAIVRGWPVVRSGSFNGKVLPVSVEPLVDLMSRAGPWGVDENRLLSLAAVPSAATLQVQMVERPADTTSQEYLTDLVGKYLSSTAGGAVRYMRVSSNRTPRVERVVDMTGLGAIPDVTSTASQSSALDLLNGTLGQVAPLPPAITGAFTISTKGLLTLGGVVVPVSRLRPSTRLRLRAVQPSVDGSLNLTSSVEVDVDTVAWEADSDTVSVTPVTGTPRDLNGILELLVKPPASALEDFAA